MMDTKSMELGFHRTEQQQQLLFNSIEVKLSDIALRLYLISPVADKHTRQRSIRLVKEAQQVLEDFNKLEMKCNMLMEKTDGKFPQISEKIGRFKEMCSEFNVKFQQTVEKKLPSIGVGGQEEAALAEILNKRHSSPFNSDVLKKWIRWKEREVYTVNFFTDMINTKIVPSLHHVNRELDRATYAVCFVFTSLGASEPYLSALSHYLNRTNPDEPQDPHSDDVRDQWFASKEITNEMRHKATLFRDFAEANKEKKNMRFLTLSLTDEMFKGCSIYLYVGGFPDIENFEPSSKPEAVTVSDITHNSVTLKVSPPKFGADNVRFYFVEYRVCGDDKWQREKMSNKEVRVRGLRLDTEYEFRCRAATSVWVGPHRDVSGSVRTLPCCPPGKPQVDPNSTQISVSWEEPSELGPDVHIQGYVVEFAKTGNGLKEDDLVWKQIRSGCKESVISGLQSETEYVVRVRGDCGVSGSSKESVGVSVKTTKQKYAHNLLRHINKRMNSEAPSCHKLHLDEEDTDIDGCRMYNFGKESIWQNRTIMLLGATGAGKSTLINRMINYITGVEWKDDFRFKLVDDGQLKPRAEGQTSVYKLNHQEGFQIPFSLTIIDTPGFGDSRDRDRMTVEQIRSLFSAEHGVPEIDAVCFVAKAELSQLTQTEKYMFDSVLSIFGKDIAENIRVLVTFCDGQRLPVLEAINAADVPCPKAEDNLPLHFKFNNSALFAVNKCVSDDDNDENADLMFWKMGDKSMKRFFTDLNRIKTKSLTLTEEVLKERKKLVNALESLKKYLTLK